jgi:nucleotide-binding universal stress UspA family protein
MKISKILIAYDGSDCANAAVEDLRRAGLPEKAHAIVLSIVENWLPPSSSLEIIESIDYRQEVLALARRASAHLRQLMPGWLVEPMVGFGSPASVIVEKADEWKPDLIVVGSHGRTAAGRFFFGSVSQALLHQAHCAVRVARGRVEEQDRPVRLIIGVDGSKYSQSAVDAVAARHWPMGGEARLINGSWKVPMATSERMLSQIADWITTENARVKKMIEAGEKALQDSGLATSAVMKEEEPKRLLLSEAERWDADCIFVGAHGMGRLERFLIGSVSSAVAARAHCSVEVIRIPEETSKD